MDEPLYEDTFFGKIDTFFYQANELRLISTLSLESFLRQTEKTLGVARTDNEYLHYSNFKFFKKIELNYIVVKTNTDPLEWDTDRKMKEFYNANLLRICQEFNSNISYEVFLNEMGKTENMDKTIYTEYENFRKKYLNLEGGKPSQNSRTRKKKCKVLKRIAKSKRKRCAKQTQRSHSEKKKKST